MKALEKSTYPRKEYPAHFYHLLLLDKGTQTHPFIYACKPNSTAPVGKVEDK